MASEFHLYRADPKSVPPGITHAGIVRTPDGESFGIHARVVECDGRKEFVGALYRIDLPDVQSVREPA